MRHLLPHFSKQACLLCTVSSLLQPTTNALQQYSLEPCKQVSLQCCSSRRAQVILALANRDYQHHQGCLLLLQAWTAPEQCVQQLHLHVTGAYLRDVQPRHVEEKKRREKKRKEKRRKEKKRKAKQSKAKKRKEKKRKEKRRKEKQSKAKKRKEKKRKEKKRGEKKSKAKKRTCSGSILAGLEGGCIVGAVHAVHAPASHHHGGSALILLRVALLPHAEGLHCETILLHLQQKPG